MSYYLNNAVINLSISATFENEGCCIQMPEALYKMVNLRNFASKTHLVYFSHFPKIFI